MHQYLMEALINPHFKHLRITLSGSVKVLLTPLGKVHRSTLSVNVDYITLMSNMKLCLLHNICVYE